jgi:hypothetical protein
VTGGRWPELDRLELERRHLEACELLISSEEEIARLASTLELASREIEAARSELASAREDVAQLELELREVGELRALREAQLDGVLASASWQVTRPLRVLKAIVRESGT